MGSGSEINPLGALLIVALILFMVLVVALVVTITQAQRRIPVQQAKRMVGRKVMNGGTQYLPLKLNYSGVMPVIFATAILALPVMVVRQIWGDASSVTHVVSVLMSPTDVGYYIISAIMIFFFSYFWVATMFQPQQISEDMQRSGSYIPGVRPGQPTATYLDQTMSRLTFAGSLFLTLIYFLPSLLYVWGGLNMVVTQFFGGTSLLIRGCALDVMCRGGNPVAKELRRLHEEEPQPQQIQPPARWCLREQHRPCCPVAHHCRVRTHRRGNHGGII